MAIFSSYNYSKFDKNDHRLVKNSCLRFIIQNLSNSHIIFEATMLIMMIISVFVVIKPLQSEACAEDQDVAPGLQALIKTGKK